MLEAIDYKTGTIRWSHPWDGGGGHNGLLSTAGNLVFTGGSGGIEALNATTGAALWHARLGSPVTNGPITYELDGLQYVVVGAGSSLVAFVMNQ
jgi:alcohol dehydrogenase (cytochrome c)